MTKKLMKAISALNSLCYVTYLASFFLFLAPLSSWYRAWRGQTATTILHGQNFLSVTAHPTVSAAVVASFPSWGYAGLMTVGIVLMTIGELRFLKAFMKILDSLMTGDYFTAANAVALRQMVTAQFWQIGGTFCLAVANQLTTSWLGRVGNGTFSANWSDLGNSLIGPLILTIIYALYSRAVGLKTENDLTV
ncbi:DUF2975 domain-containing protein [Levilactobacillus enshiensis]|uniref:DUF2975 domain-containing protein n=1 Tax=Levilactobacillus enshiensis TaxID=2590213 RepID=UPI00131E5D12|nr:DUF2975 domain-containing protein [Levilactobacillus enshiensis]